ncbi:bifunctional enoyl-CoA hydratase/phosphate acetyltransferase [Thermotoga sp.]|uniref:bifunctional enoyl-CoA hydratase/phosphate acetyltransferase n=1 Tax=Thermotoga sp. TaxID=28240 RepID=UPI0025F84FE0|nr:bifunctional enoyl-CoA hydratase/phosphate acetyltransferase [Thermotoga sp.]MCD6550778.1 bifunctional enoyl-CoA hydratase/phosphate acetyltransferase [Thermotoga sp.]
MKKLDDFLELAQSFSRSARIAVAGAQDENVLESVRMAQKMNIVEPILYGNTEKIEKTAKFLGIKLDGMEIVHAPNLLEAGKMAVRGVAEGKADLLMKGKIKTSELMSLVLQKEYGLRTGRTLSAVSVLEVPSYHKLLIISDGGIVISPDLKQKRDIVENAVMVARTLGVDTPKVAIIGATEIAEAPSTLDAAILSKMSGRGQIRGCVVDGPLSLDDAVGKKAASLKGVESHIAGDADVLIVPYIESGNIFSKALIYLEGARAATVVVGARMPIVLTSRADSAETKLFSIALGMLIAVERE